MLRVGGESSETYYEGLVVLLELLNAAARTSVVAHRLAQGPLVHSWRRRVLVLLIKVSINERLGDEPTTKVDTCAILSTFQAGSTTNVDVP